MEQRHMLTTTAGGRPAPNRSRPVDLHAILGTAVTAPPPLTRST